MYDWGIIAKQIFATAPVLGLLVGLVIALLLSCWVNGIWYK